MAWCSLPAKWKPNSQCGPGAVTEFDRLFDVGYKSLVETLVIVSDAWPQVADDPGHADGALIDSLEQLTDSILKEWLGHSRTLRLSALEKIADDKAWQQLVEFIQRLWPRPADAIVSELRQSPGESCTRESTAG